MKRYVILFSAFLAGTALAQQTPLAPPNHSSTRAAADPHGLSPAEWRELRDAHNAALQADPTLLANHEKLVERMRALENKIDEAMVKADPTLSPIIAKFEANRPHPPAAPPAQRVGGTPAI